MLGLVILLNGCAQPTKAPIEITPPSEQPEIIQPKPVIEKQKITEPVVIIEPDPVKETFNIAAMLPMSGRSAHLGQQLLRGIELALFKYANDDINLTIYDTQGRRFAAIQQTKKIVADGTDIVIGPLYSHITEAVIPILQEQKIPIISFSNRNDLLNPNQFNQVSDIHILGITPKEELHQLIEIGTFSGFKNFALIAPDDEYGQKIHQEIRDLLRQTDANLAKFAYYNTNNIDFSTAVQTISDFKSREIAYNNEVKRLIESGIEDEKEREKLLNYKETFGPLPFDAIILITYDDNSLRTLAAQLEYYDVEPENAKFMGLRQWQNYPNLHLEPSLQGSWFVGLDPVQFNKYQQLHQSIYQSNDSFLAALGFDAMAMLTQYSAANNDPMPKITALKQGILGATGAFRLENDGTVSRKMALFEVNNTGTKILFNALKNW